MWTRDPHAASKSASALPKPVEAASFRPVDDGDGDALTVELYSSRQALDSFAALYGSIVDQDSGAKDASRARFSVRSPKGIDFTAYSRGVTGVGGGPVESFEIVLFSKGSAVPPVRVSADVRLGSAILSGAKTPEAAAAQVLSEFGL